MRISISGFLLCLMVASPTLANAELIITNNLKVDIESITCILDSEGNAPQVIEVLEKDSSIEIYSAVPHDCTRFSVLMKDGVVWEFFSKVPLGKSGDSPDAISGASSSDSDDDFDEMEISLNSPNPNWALEQFIPHVLLIKGDEIYETPAGLPFRNMVQIIRDGFTKVLWSQLISSKDTAKFVLNLGGSSWNQVRAPRYEELTSGENFVSLVSFSTPLHHSTLDSTIEALKKEGFKLMSQPNTIAEGYGDGTFYNITWDDVSKELQKSSNLTFRGEGVHVSLTLGKEDGTLWIEFQRGAEPAVG